MRLLWILLVLTAGCNCNQTNLQEVSKCGDACYTGTEPIKGSCRAGKLECDDEGTVIGCKNEVLPTTETCNGLDDDCDGYTDEQVTRVCSTACGSGDEICSNGTWLRCSARTPDLETCNGKDDDCDGKVDESEDLPVRFCYQGDPKELQFGLCRPGIERCENGGPRCVGAVYPTAEICDGLDNNCNGPIDEGTDNGKGIDFVAVVDNSGSMGGYLGQVVGGVSDFATKYASKDIRWALVTAPDPDFVMWESKVHLYTNFTDAGAFWNAMGKQNGTTGSSYEPTLDALYDICVTSNPLGLSWKSGNDRLVVLFSDEEPQSFNYFPGKDMSDVVAACKGRVKLVVFTHVQPFWPGYAAWKAVVDGVGGQMFEIDSFSIAQTLETVVKDATCQ